MMKSNEKVTFLGYVCVIRGLFKGLPPGAQKTQFFQLSFIFLRTVAPKLKKLESHTTSHFEAL